MTEDQVVQGYITKDDLRETLNTALNEHDAVIMERVEKLVSDRVGDEAKKRQSDISSVRADIARVDSKLDGRLDSIDGQLKSLDQSINKIDAALARLAGVMDGVQTVISNTMRSNRQLDERMMSVEKDLDERHERVRNDISLLTSNQASLTAQIKVTHGAIFGVPGESGPMSLYESIEALRSDLTHRITQVLDSSNQNRQSIDALTEREDARAAAEERKRAIWEKRRGAVIAGVKVIATSRVALGLALAGVGAAIVSIAPDLAQILEQILLID